MGGGGGGVSPELIKHSLLLLVWPEVGQNMDLRVVPAARKSALFSFDVHVIYVRVQIKIQ